MVEAFSEQLITIDELRDRMPHLRAREASLRGQLDALDAQAADRDAYLKLADDLEGFLARLRGTAATATLEERRRVLRLLVKDVLIGPEKITIRHRIPVRERAGSGHHDTTDTEGDMRQNYELCWGRDFPVAPERRVPRTGGGGRGPVRARRHPYCVSKDPVLVGGQALGVAQAHLAAGPADPFVGPGLPEADRCDLVPRVAGAFGHCENSVRQARRARRCARAASLSRCPAGSPPRALPAGYGSTLFPGSAGLISVARAWIRGAPRRRSRVPTGRRRPRWCASSTPRCA